MKRITESESAYSGLENLSVSDILTFINQEDQTVALAVKRALPAIEKLTQAAIEALRSGNRVFYLGAGTSGRLGIVDASELPPTYGVPQGMVIGLIAGGDGAIRKAVEFAEDNKQGGWRDLQAYQVHPGDLVIGIAASGTTPYVVGTLEICQEQNIRTGCITCNENAPVIEKSDFPVVVVTGPEFVTGSTRMKAGTAQKLVLNMISTATMIQLGHVKGNKMVDMQLSNSKLIDRGTRMIMEETQLDYDTAQNYLILEGSVRKAIEAIQRK